MKKTSREQANEVLNDYQDCKVIEVSTSRTGYPEGLHYGVYGFDTMDDAIIAQKLYGGQLVEFHKRVGWVLWNSTGQITGDYDIYDELVEDYDEVYLHDADPIGILEDAKERIEDCNDLYEIKNIAMRAFNITNCIEDIDETQAICVSNGEIEIRELRPMQYSRRTDFYAVGLEFFGEQ